MKDMSNLMDILWNTAGNVYWKDIQGRYLGCNKNMAEILGIPLNEIIGKTDRELFSNKVSMDKILILEQADQSVINSKEEKSFEEEAIDKYGKPAYYTTKKMPLYNENNELIGLIGSSIDITQQKLYEVRDHIIEQVPCNLYWKDMNGNYLGCNEEFAKVLGLQNPKDIIGKNDHDFFLESEYVKEIIETDQKVISLNKTIVLEEIGTGKDGQHAVYMTKKTPLINKEGTIVGIIGSSVDITKEKQAEIIKKEFVSSMSHDIRTPFCGIYSVIAMLHDQEEDINKKEMLKCVLDSSDTLLKFLNQILNLISYEKLSIQETDFNIRELVDDVIKLMKPSIETNSITLEIDCPDVIINTDRMSIECILVNLIGNAIKFTHEGKIIVRVKAAPHLSIEIEDTGIGIDEDKLEIIFDKFYRVLPTYRENKFNGVGIGLYISRLLAKELKGDISVKSKKGQGSCFKFAIDY